MGVKKYIFQKLQEIMTYEPTIKHVGIWNDGMVEPEKLEQYNTPALMVEFETINWKQQTPTQIEYIGKRIAEITVNIHVIYKNNKKEIETFFLKEDIREAVLKFMTISNTLYSNKLILIAETEDTNPTIIHDLTLTFKTECYEEENEGYTDIISRNDISLDSVIELNDTRLVYEFETTNDIYSFENGETRELYKF